MSNGKIANAHLEWLDQDGNAQKDNAYYATAVGANGERSIRLITREEYEALKAAGVPDEGSPT